MFSITQINLYATMPRPNPEDPTLPFEEAEVTRHPNQPYQVSKNRIKWCKIRCIFYFSFFVWIHWLKSDSILIIYQLCKKGLACKRFIPIYLTTFKGEVSEMLYNNGSQPYRKDSRHSISSDTLVESSLQLPVAATKEFYKVALQLQAKDLLVFTDKWQHFFA